MLRIFLTDIKVMEKLKEHESKSTVLPSSSPPLLSNLNEENGFLAHPELKNSGDFSRFENNDELKLNIQKRTLPRAAFAISLEYMYDFDDKGVFYYIGTKGYAEAWSNPAARGLHPLFIVTIS